MFQHDRSCCLPLLLGQREGAAVVAEGRLHLLDESGQQSAAQEIVVGERVVGAVGKGVFAHGVAVEIEVQHDLARALQPAH